MTHHVPAVSVPTCPLPLGLWGVALSQSRAGGRGLELSIKLTWDTGQPRPQSQGGETPAF